MHYVFDVDGTLSFDGKKIARPIVNALKSLELSGHTVSFASARPIRDLVPIVPDFSDGHLLIGGNGSIVKTIDDEIKLANPIDSKSFDSIKHVINNYQLNYIVDDSWNYSAKINTTNKIYKQLDPDNLAKNVNLETIYEPIKIILVNIPQSIFNDLLEKLQSASNLAIVAHSGENSIDITAAEINKFNTLQQYYQNEYYAFGNDSNDFELLSHAKISVWVGGNNERLKQLDLTPSIIVSRSINDVSTIIEHLNV